MSIEISRTVSEYWLVKDLAPGHTELPSAYDVSLYLLSENPGDNPVIKSRLGLKQKKSPPSSREVVIAAYSGGKIRIGFKPSRGNLGTHQQVEEDLTYYFGKEDLENIFHGAIVAVDSSTGRKKLSHKLVLFKVNQTIRPQGNAEDDDQIRLMAQDEVSALPSGLTYPERIANYKFMNSVAKALHTEVVEILAIPISDKWVYPPELVASLQS
jgi:hypothetical protein